MNNKMLRKVSLIIPVLNEENTVKRIIKECSSQKVIKQLVIVNDGSTDNTKNILEEIQKKEKSKGKKLTLTIFHHPHNKGKGAAIKTGLSKTVGEFVMVQDADLEYSPKDIPKLLKEAIKVESGIVFGTRSRGKKKGYLLARLGNLYLNIMFRIFFGLNLSDSYTCYKLMPRKVWIELGLKSSGFEIDSELVSKLGLKGYKVYEVPISYFPRKYHEGKKIRWLDLIKATLIALKLRFNLSLQ